MFILKKGHQPGVYVPLRALFLVKLLLLQKHQWTKASLISLNSFVKNTFVGLNFNYLFQHHA